MADEDDGFPLCDELAEVVEQLVDLLGHQHRRGFVQDEELGATVQHLDDLHPLLLSNGEAADLGRGIQDKAVLPAELGHPLLRLAHPQPAESPDRFAPQDHVLGHGKHWDQHEMLVHHANPQLQRPARALDGDRVALDGNGPLVGLVEPVEDAHEGGLAGAVLSHDGVNLPAVDRQIDTIVGDDAGEALRNSL